MWYEGVPGSLCAKAVSPCYRDKTQQMLQYVKMRMCEDVQ